ncbi:MAG TPA: FAD-dependent oxidoreductase [Burkholderiales bacterium]|nr:FAD-dependent oxidoreductase [Burkholderiales bacterium]
MDTDVLVVGAGPTGLMLANQLARRGVRPLIIDRHSGPAQQSRAMAVQARTLEIYSKMGIAEKALELGARGTAANMWAQGKHTARIPIGDIGRSMSPFPFVLMLGQDDNERIMGAKLRDYGLDVQWNTELVAFEQHPDHVAATLRQPDGTTRRISAAWVAGCDGSRSPVREMSRITFPGAPYEHEFFVADTEAIGSMKQGELNVYLWQDGFHLFFPMRGKDRWRVIGILPRNLRHRDDLTFEEVVPAIQREAGADLSFKSCSWMSTYRIHHRAAERFRDRRCFLLGDAAHVHSPMGAQGMNTGLQDAYNLAWKLALVIEGRADAALLDSYEQERIPVAQRLLRTTDRAFQLVVTDNRIASLFRTKIIARIAARAMTVQRVRNVAFRTISQIGIRYRKSPLSQTLAGLPEGAPRAGDRFPWLKLRFSADGPIEDLFQALDDTRFSLLVFGQPAPSAEALGLGDVLRVHRVPDDRANLAELARVGISGSAFYLLRPDGHVGFAGTRLAADAVRRYLSERHIHVSAGAERAAAHSLRTA